MTTITTNSTIGLTLSAGGYTNPFEIATGVTISNAGAALYAGVGLTPAIRNAGSVYGSLSGVSLAGGGAVSNTSTGLIRGQGGAYAIRAAGPIGVINDGTIATSDTASGTAIRVVSGSATIANNASGTIAGGNTGLVALGDASVVNAGTIAGTTGIGMFLNGTTATATNSATGLISGKNNGIYANVLAVTNAGRIASAGNAIRVFGTSTVANLAGGTIAGTAKGVDLATGGTVTNAAGGLIQGYAGIDGENGALSITNDGTIGSGSTTAGIGVTMRAASGSSTIANNASAIVSGYTGLFLAGVNASIANAGTIAAGPGRGIFLSAATATVTNSASGVISGASAGIFSTNQIAGISISNAGRIAGTSSGIAGSGTFAIANLAGGTISGGFNAIDGGTGGGTAPVSLANAGLVSGTHDGVYIVTGGTVANLAGGTISGGSAAVQFSAGQADRVIVSPGAVFVGIVDGGNTIGATAVSTLELASGASTGTLSGLGTNFVNFAQVTVDVGANWVFDTTDTVVAGVTLTNSGTIGAQVTTTSGFVSNTGAGTISGGVYSTGAGAGVSNAGVIDAAAAGVFGVSMKNGGTVSNSSSGRITGYDNGIDLRGTAVLTNAGIISRGSGFRGGSVIVREDATATIANNLSGTISGYYGIDVLGTAAVINDGTISTGSTSDGVGVFVRAGASGTVVNNASATIAGSTGVTFRQDAVGATVVNQGLIGGDYLGIYLHVSNAVVTNAANGTISGRSGGIGGTGAGGTATISNAGTISAEYVGPFGPSPGIKLRGTDVVSNLAGGVVSGFAYGIWSQFDTTILSFSNAGLVSATKTGVSLAGKGTVSNLAGGTIAAAYGVTGGNNGPVTVANAGTLSGSSKAVKFFAGQADRVIVSPGAVFVGAVDGGNTIGATVVSTLELASAASTGTLSGIGTSVVNFGSIVFDAGSQWFLQGNAAGFAGTIAGFAAGDTIEIAGINATGSNYAGGVLTLTTGSGTTSLSLTGASPFSTGNFRVTNVGGNVDISLACFRAGTRIRTPDGDVAVEDLRVGGAVCTLLDGPARRIAWIGHRTVDCRRHPRPEKVLPIRVSAGAFGPGLPARPLYLSPDHAVYVGDVLIPVGLLTNGRSIAQVPVDEVTYYHIELPEHDVVLAEGLPAESFLDTGNRANFENSEGATRLWPDFSMPPNHVSAIWEAQGCAPLVVHGAILDSVRAGLDFLEFENFALDADAGRG